jgi:deferrochelatase/peroxidase EfeB
VNRAAVEVWKAIVDDDLPLKIRGAYDGFARDDGRSWIGFHDGVSNIRPSQRLAAVECVGDPDWNQGGTYLAFLRCAVDLAAWRRLTREEQEILVGRDKLSGCALEGVSDQDGQLAPRPFPGCPAAADADPQERDKFRDPPESGEPIVEASHIHRANQNRTEPTTHAGHRIFRQGYEYLDGFADGPRLGLNFVSFQRDLEHLWQILGLPSWLGGVNFGGRDDRGANEPPPIELISLEAGGLYAAPPQAEPFPGAQLFE